jgi:hypothetical protein
MEEGNWCVEVCDGDVGPAYVALFESWIDCEEDRRKKGIEDGVKRLLWPRRTEDVGLLGFWDVVRVVPWFEELDSVPVLLARSTDEAGALEEDPIDEMEASEAAELMASD